MRRARTVPRQVGVGLALVMALGGVTRNVGHAADDPEPAPGAPASPRRDGPGADTLPTADVVVIGTVRVLVPPRGVGGVTVLRVTREKVLRGAADPTFTLFVGGGRNTAQATRPTVPWFAPDTTGRFALFLTPTPHGSGLSLTAAFRADDEAGREKAEVLEGELRIAAEPDEARRGPRWMTFLFDLLGTTRSWSRRYAVTSLERLAVERPGLLSGPARAELEAIARRTFEEDLRARLARVLRGATDPTEEVGRAEGSATLSPAYHRMLREFATLTDPEARVVAVSELARLGRAAAGPELLRLAVTDPAVEVRERATVLLGDVGAREAATPLRTRFDVEDTPAVREAIVRAVGALGDEGDVAWLVARADVAALQRPVAFALARIRSPGALSALDELVAPRDGVPPPDALARLVEYLRGDAFVEAERLAGRGVGPRPRRGEAPIPDDERRPDPDPDACPTPVGEDPARPPAPSVPR